MLVLRFYEDMTENEAAAMMGCTIGTVKSQTAKALARLRVDADLHAWPGHAGLQAAQVDGGGQELPR